MPRTGLVVLIDGAAVHALVEQPEKAGRSIVGSFDDDIWPCTGRHVDRFAASWALPDAVP